MGTDKRNGRDRLYRSNEQSASPAARRRQEEGYRKPEDFDTESFVCGDFTLTSFDDFDDDGEFGPEGFEQSSFSVFDLDNFEITLEGVDELEEESPRQSKNRHPETTSVEKKSQSKKKTTKPNEAKSMKTSNHKKSKKHSAEQEVNTKKVKDKVGVFFVGIQLVASVAFLVTMLVLNVFPFVYAGVITAVVGLLFLLVKGSQYKHKKHRGFGKFSSIVISMGLTLGAYCFALLLLAFIDLGYGNENDCTANLSRDTYNLYISGNDKYGELDSGATGRSDVNLITTVNPMTGQILMTTTPRDYYVQIPGVSGNQRDKLTHAGNYGVGASMDTLAQLYDTPIDIYLRVNFTSVINIIDVLGGVTVNSDVAFTTGKESGAIVEVQEGKNTFTGEEALAFARERHALDDGDDQRGKNQQALLKGIFYKTMSPTIIFKLADLVDCVKTEVGTNMTTSQLQQFVKGILRGGIKTNIYSVAAEGTSSREYCYSYSGNSLYVTIPIQSSVDSIKSYMEDVKKGKDLPTE